MKKYIYSIPAAALLMLSACSAEEGTMPGTDPNPAVTVYSYTPTEDGANPDNDIMVRFVTNKNAKEVYYLVEKDVDITAFFSSAEYKDNPEAAEAAYVKRVVDNGTKLDVNGVEDIYLTLKDIHGANTISAVAYNGSYSKRTKVYFTGLDWSYFKSGTFYPRQSFLSTPVQCELQVCTTDKTLYRLKNVFGAEYSMKIQCIGDKLEDADGEYYLARIPEASTPYNLSFADGTTSSVWVEDVGYWQNNSSFVTSETNYANIVYTDGYCILNIAWMTTKGCVAYGTFDGTYSVFVPD